VGFDILSFLAQGLLPAIRAGGLPVQVNAPAASELTVTPTLAYLDNSSPPKLVPASTLERNEPFETQRDYVLAAMMLWAVVLTRPRN
jgi:hypothetical protein